jgi:predicted DNA-binding transcriptional regulator AlpA
MNKFPTDSLMRLSQIIGNPRDGSPALIPVSKSSWWLGVKNGRYPAPVKLGPRTTAWRSSEIAELIEKLGDKK